SLKKNALTNQITRKDAEKAVKVADWRQRQGGLQKCEGTCWRAKWGHWESDRRL
ncbi:hypothetical protein QQF64_001436, partial [Cirrhinus molitorella]